MTAILTTWQTWASLGLVLVLASALDATAAVLALGCGALATAVLLVADGATVGLLTGAVAALPVVYAVLSAAAFGLLRRFWLGRAKDVKDINEY